MFEDIDEDCVWKSGVIRWINKLKKEYSVRCLNCWVMSATYTSKLTFLLFIYVGAASSHYLEINTLN